MKDKRVLYGIVAAVVLLLVVGGVLFARSRSNSATPSLYDDEFSQPIEKLKPEDIGLTLVLSPDKKKVKFMASKLSDVSKLSWEFSYDADVPTTGDFAGEEGQKITQAFEGETDVTGSSYESEFRELGSCSSGRCRFDAGVEKVNILLKVTKKDGKVYQVEDSIDL